MTENIQNALEPLRGIAQRISAAGLELTQALLACRLEPEGFLVCTGEHLLSGSEAQGASALDAAAMRERYPRLFSLLQALPKAGYLLQTPAPYCALAAAGGEELPPILDDMAQIIGPRARICVEDDIPRLVRVLKRQPACIVRSAQGGGLLAAARQPEELFTSCLVLEKSAQAFVLGRKIGGARPLLWPEAQLMHLGYLLSYSKKSGAVRRYTAESFPGQVGSGELQLRTELVALGKRLVENNLVQGTWGNISARLDEKHMLCTPSGLHYETIGPYDIVRVALDTLEHEGETKPTSEKGFHAALLQKHSDVECIIHAHPPWSSVFAAARTAIAVSDPEARRLLCGDISLAKYGFPGSKTLAKNVTAAIEANRACVMENHGMLSCGASLEEAYARCEAVELTARGRLGD